MSRKWGLKTILFKWNIVLCVFPSVWKAADPRHHFNQGWRGCWWSHARCRLVTHIASTQANDRDQLRMYSSLPALKSLILHDQCPAKTRVKRVLRQMSHELVYHSQTSLNSKCMYFSWSSFKEGHVVACYCQNRIFTLVLHVMLCSDHFALVFVEFPSPGMI